jgi:hypothetical protein
MGEAATVVSDDATALYWNPAALTNVRARSVTLMDAPYVASSYFDYAAYAQNLGRYGAFGAGLQYFSLGGLNATDASGASLGATNPYDLAFSLGYAYRFTDTNTWLDGFSAGASGKYISQKIVTSATTFAADLGLLSPSYLDQRLRLAAAVMNAGPAVKFDQATAPLPLTLKIGSAYQINPRWLAALDLAAPRGGSVYAALGTEYQLIAEDPWSFALRGGYDTQTLGSVDGFAGISVGFGLGYRGGSFDYAFVPLGSVGQAHRLSLNYRF